MNIKNKILKNPKSIHIPYVNSVACLFLNTEYHPKITKENNAPKIPCNIKT